MRTLLGASLAEKSGKARLDVVIGYRNSPTQQTSAVRYPEDGRAATQATPARNVVMLMPGAANLTEAFLDDPRRSTSRPEPKSHQQPVYNARQVSCCAYPVSVSVRS